MYEDVHYKRTFLRQVICRIDYASPLKEMSQRLSPDVYSRAILTFPIAEPKPFSTAVFRIQVGRPSQPMPPAQKGTNWIFHGERREKSIAFAPDHLDITYREYQDFEQLQADCIEVLQTLGSAYPILQAKRVGLRYVNNVQLNDPEPLNWSGLIAAPFLAGFGIVPDKENLARVFNTVVVMRDDIQLICQYGIHNPDFPARIRKKQFILDFDAGRSGPTDWSDIPALLNRQHEMAQTLFESSITDALRSQMNA